MKKHEPPKPVKYPRAILPVANFRPTYREMAQFQKLRLSDTHYDYFQKRRGSSQ